MSENRIVPAQRNRTSDEESLDVWGFRDSAFQLLPNGSVTLTGSRYALSGTELPDLWPWMSRVLGVPLHPDDRHDPHYPPEIPPARSNPGFQAEIGELDVFMTVDPEVRLRHGHGHTVEEMYLLK